MRLYRLVFQTRDEALQLESQLQYDPETGQGYKALDIRGKQNATITPAFIDEDGVEHEAVIDERYFATVITDVEVPEITDYITDVPYFPMHYGGEEDMEIMLPVKATKASKASRASKTPKRKTSKKSKTRKK